MRTLPLARTVRCTELGDRGDVSLVARRELPRVEAALRHLGNPTTRRLAGLDTETAQALAAHGKKLIEAHAWAQTVPPGTPSRGVISDDVAADYPTAGQLQQLGERTLAYRDTPIKPVGAVQADRERTLRPSRRPHHQTARGDPAGRHRNRLRPRMHRQPGTGLSVGSAPDPRTSRTGPNPQVAPTSPFADWAPMTEESEAQLVANLWAWLQQQIALAEQRQLTVKIYGYNLASTETSPLRRISATGAAPGLPTLDELGEFTAHDRYVDLLGYMKQKWISNDGSRPESDGPGTRLQLEADDDPGGFNSIDWYREAVDNNEPGTRSDASSTTTATIAARHSLCAKRERRQW